MNLHAVELAISLIGYLTILVLKYLFPRLLRECITPLANRYPTRWPAARRLSGIL
jgi:hypothetical protein